MHTDFPVYNNKDDQRKEYGEFGIPVSPTVPNNPNDPDNNNVNNPSFTPYMSALNNNIITSIPATNHSYYPSTFNEPFHHTYKTPKNNNGSSGSTISNTTSKLKSAFFKSNRSNHHSLNITDKYPKSMENIHNHNHDILDDDDSQSKSRTSSVHESYSSKQSLTKATMK